MHKLLLKVGRSLRLRRGAAGGRALPTVLSAVTAAALLVGCGRGGSAGRPWSEFVRDLGRVENLSRLDSGSVGLLSSYDRRGGNDDFNAFVGFGTEPEWYVIADLKGPGVIRRFWTTGTGINHPVRLYLDGGRRPSFEGTLEELCGDRPPFVYPWAQMINQCAWSYVPWTYARSLRIEIKALTWGPRRLFFHVNSETFTNAVQSLPRRLSPEDQQALDEVSRQGEQSLRWPEFPASSGNVQDVPGGADAVMFQADGPGTIADWYLEIRPGEGAALSQRAKERLIQDCVLEVRYDGLADPSISAPVGDFFCNAWRRRSFASMFLGSGPSGYHCALPMPYGRRVEVRLRNYGAVPVRIRSLFNKRAGVHAQDGYLHAEWNKSGPAAGRPHTIVHTEGEGKYVGCYLAVTALARSWWILEGDEMMFADGRRDPVWHGTGLEDYFNGGWYYRGATFGPFHGVMDRYPFRAAQYRFHLVDPVRFARSFDVVIEKGDRNVSEGFMRSVGWYYLRAPRGVPPCPAAGDVRRAEENPFERLSIVVQLLELERMNDYAAARGLIAEWLERYPDFPHAGVLKLRDLEYRRLLGEPVAAAEYEPFAKGEHGEDAAKQAQQLLWFYESPRRALVGLNANARCKVYLDPAPGKPGEGLVLAADNPLDFAVTGIELPEEPGEHVLAGIAVYVRPWAWVQFGLRTHSGVAGTGPDTVSTVVQPESGRWPGVSVFERAAWETTFRSNFMRGPPHDEVYMDAKPNAFVLLPSKIYGLRAPDWEDVRGIGLFRTTFRLPLTTTAPYARSMVGLPE